MSFTTYSSTKKIKFETFLSLHMNSREITTGVFWAIIRLLGLCIVAWLIFQLKSLIVYMLIAGVVSLIGRPISQFLTQRLKLNSILASTTSIIFLLGVLISIFSLFVPLFIKQVENLALLDVDLLKINIETLVNEISIYFQLDNTFWQQQLSVDNLFKNVNFGLLPELINQTLELFGGFTVGLFSIIFILFFFLKDSFIQKRIILAMVEDKISDKVEKSINKIKNLLSRYFLGLLMQISILLIIYSIVLAILDVQNAFVICFSVCAFKFNSILGL